VSPIDVPRRVLGDPSRVTGFTADTRDAGLDTEAAAVPEYDDAMAKVSCGFETPGSRCVRVEAPNGCAEVKGAFNVDGETALRYSVDGRTVTETFDPVDQYGLEVEHFADSVGTAEAPITDAESGAATLRVVDAESAASGAAVDLDRRDRRPADQRQFSQRERSPRNGRPQRAQGVGALSGADTPGITSRGLGRGATSRRRPRRSTSTSSRSAIRPRHRPRKRSVGNTTNTAVLPRRKSSSASITARRGCRRTRGRRCSYPR